MRVRPIAEINDRCIEVSSNTSLLFDDGSNRPRRYAYDYVFGEDASQETVYEKTTAPLVRDVLNGLQAAVFAYGATGSGKTHTMLGPNPKRSTTTDNQSPSVGLMLQAIESIFKYVESSDDSKSFRVSFYFLNHILVLVYIM